MIMEILALVFSSSQALPFKYLSFAQAELCKVVPFYDPKSTTLGTPTLQYG